MTERNIFKNLFIFEMANSHQGSVEHGKAIIKEMGKIARKYKIKAAVKLQYRELDSFIHPSFKEREDVAHIPRFLSTRLGYDEFTQLVESIREEGMMTMSTPFDEVGVDWCIKQKIDIIKIASCSALDWPLLTKVAGAGKPLIISTGGKELSDIDKLYTFYTHRGCKFAFLHCIAQYPAPLENLQLDFIDRMKRRYKDITIGYSGHENPEDNMVPMLAIAKGATILERHVGLETDLISLNAYSMNPMQTDKWVESALLAKTICETKKENNKLVLPEEKESLRSLMRGVYANKSIDQLQEITREDVYFAMPCIEGQLTSGEFKEGMIASIPYSENVAITESPKTTGIGVVRKAIHDAKGMLFEAGIALGSDFEVELSHQYGMKKFPKCGAVIINIINREYCKKLLIVLEGQKHPLHAHHIKEETFQVLYGELQIQMNDEKEQTLKAGDIHTVLRGEYHGFSSIKGAIFEEISTRHFKSDSYYKEDKISSKDPMERKTFLKKW